MPITWQPSTLGCELGHMRSVTDTGMALLLQPSGAEGLCAQLDADNRLIAHRIDGRLDLAAFYPRVSKRGIFRQVFRKRLKERALIGIRLAVKPGSPGPRDRYPADDPGGDVEVLNRHIHTGMFLVRMLGCFLGRRSQLRDGDRFCSLGH